MERIRTFDEENDYFDSNRSSTRVVAAAGAARDFYRDSNGDGDNGQCISYPGFWVGTDHPWEFTAQLCVVLGPILAFVSLCLISLGNPKRFWGCTLLLLTTGIQTASIIASLSWCSFAHKTYYWNCPWLVGALVNLIASALFLTSWILALLGLVDDEDKHQAISGNAETVNTGNKNDQHVKKGDRSASAENNTNNTSTQPNNSLESRSYPSSVLVGNGNRIDLNSTVTGETDYFRATDDLENGGGGPTSVKALYRRVENETSPGSKSIARHTIGKEGRDSSSIQRHELYYDAGCGTESNKKASAALISNCNQMFLDLDAKMMHRRDTMIKNNSIAGSDSLRDDEVSSIDTNIEP